MRANACKPPGTCVDPTHHMAHLKTCRILLSRGCSADVRCVLCGRRIACEMARTKDPRLVKALRMVANGVDPEEAWADCGRPTTRRNFE